MNEDLTEHPNTAVETTGTTGNVGLWNPFAQYKNVQNCRALAVVLGYGKARTSLTPSLSSHPLVRVLVDLQLPALGNILSFLGGSELPDKFYTLMSVSGDHGSAHVGGQEVVLEEQSYATAKEAAAAAKSFVEIEEEEEDQEAEPEFEIDSRKNPQGGCLFQESRYTPRCYLLELSLDEIKEKSDHLTDQVYCLVDIETDEGQPGNPDASWSCTVYADVETAAQGARELWGHDDLEERTENDSDFDDYTSDPKILEGVKKKGSGMLLASYCRSIRIHKLILPGYEPFIPPLGNMEFEESICKMAKEVAGYIMIDAKAINVVSNLIAAICHDIVEAAHSATSKLSFGKDSEKAIVLDAESIKAALTTMLEGNELEKYALSAGCEAVAKCISDDTSTSTAITAAADNNNISISSKAGIDFSHQVEQLVVAQMSSNGYNNTCSQGGAVYLAAVLDYMMAELVECSKSYAQKMNYSARKILYKHVAMAIKTDEELRKVFGKHSYAWGEPG